MGATDLVYLQSKTEESWGTDAAATARWMSADKFSFKPKPIFKMLRYQRGDYAPAHNAIKTSETGEGSIEGDVTFEEIPLLWSSRSGWAALPRSGTASGARQCRS